MEYRIVYPTEVIEGFTSNEMYVLMLYEPMADKKIPIMIGEHEANMILLEQEQIQPRRPMTHQLIGSILNTFNLTLKQVCIDRFEEGIFYATLTISDGFNVQDVDARASDAVIMALSKGIDIEMATSIINEVGFTPPANDIPMDSEIQTSPTLEELEERLKQCEENEEYEKAAEILNQIEQIKTNSGNSTY